MVGNDIVDLNEARRSSNPKAMGWERPGFLQKIFTVKEQVFIANSSDQFLTVWQLWSMKESAYKVFIQAGGKRFFNPTKLECSLDSLENGQVKIGDLTLKTFTTVNLNYIFSTATLNDFDNRSSILTLPKGDVNQQSKYMHQQLITDFAKSNNLNFSELEIQKTEAGVPIFYYEKIRLNTSISLTHHGRFGAYSFD